MTIGPDRLADAVQPPETVPETIGELETEIAQLQQAVRSHAVIDQAVGVIATVGRMTPHEAWDVIRETSMCTNIKLRKVAESLVAWARSGDLPPEIRDVLTAQLKRHGAR
ncbi:ANTAR domain-containing protein [Streptomyces sp. NPDC048419]|uniref:ANTAR domain-containing protein n=1 Tax=Streptomyces sp. NPDC048419 TaxID=3365547 RepID=UPI00371A5C59